MKLQQHLNYSPGLKVFAFRSNESQVYKRKSDRPRFVGYFFSHPFTYFVFFKYFEYLEIMPTFLGSNVKAKAGVVTHNSNPSTREVEAGDHEFKTRLNPGRADLRVAWASLRPCLKNTKPSTTKKVKSTFPAPVPTQNYLLLITVDKYLPDWHYRYLAGK